MTPNEFIWWHPFPFHFCRMWDHIRLRCQLLSMTAISLINIKLTHGKEITDTKSEVRNCSSIRYLQSSFNKTSLLTGLFRGLEQRYEIASIHFHGFSVIIYRYHLRRLNCGWCYGMNKKITSDGLCGGKHLSTSWIRCCIIKSSSRMWTILEMYKLIIIYHQS